MKHLPLLLLGLSLLAAPAFAQAPTPAPSPAIEAKTGLTKFDLSFPGGTPGELVAAIEKAMGKPLNAIIPEEHASRRLPPLKMSRVDVAQLFVALSEANITHETIGNTSVQVRFGFFTTNPSHASDDSVWFFRVDGGRSRNWQRHLKTCQVYLLTPYLESGLTVDDITTAIRTGWKMLGEPEVAPSLTFHQETKLLIAVADERSLETINAVLKALERPKPAITAPSPPAPSDAKKPSKS